MTLGQNDDAKMTSPRTQSKKVSPAPKPQPPNTKVNGFKPGSIHAESLVMPGSGTDHELLEKGMLIHPANQLLMTNLLPYMATATCTLYTCVFDVNRLQIKQIIGTVIIHQVPN